MSHQFTLKKVSDTLRGRGEAVIWETVIDGARWHISKNEGGWGWFADQPDATTPTPIVTGANRAEVLARLAALTKDAQR